MAEFLEKGLTPNRNDGAVRMNNDIKIDGLLRTGLPSFDTQVAGPAKLNSTDVRLMEASQFQDRADGAYRNSGVQYQDRDAYLQSKTAFSEEDQKVVKNMIGSVTKANNQTPKLLSLEDENKLLGDLREVMTQYNAVNTGALESIGGLFSDTIKDRIKARDKKAAEEVYNVLTGIGQNAYITDKNSVYMKFVDSNGKDAVAEVYNPDVGIVDAIWYNKGEIALDIAATAGAIYATAQTGGTASAAAFAGRQALVQGAKQLAKENVKQRLTSTLSGIAAPFARGAAQSKTREFAIGAGAGSIGAGIGSVYDTHNYNSNLQRVTEDLSKVYGDDVGALVQMSQVLSLSPQERMGLAAQASSMSLIGAEVGVTVLSPMLELMFKGATKVAGNPIVGGTTGAAIGHTAAAMVDGGLLTHAVLGIGGGIGGIATSSAIKGLTKGKSIVDAGVNLAKDQLDKNGIKSVDDLKAVASDIKNGSAFKSVVDNIPGGKALMDKVLPGWQATPLDVLTARFRDFATDPQKLANAQLAFKRVGVELDPNKTEDRILMTLLTQANTSQWLRAIAKEGPSDAAPNILNIMKTMSTNVTNQVDNMTTSIGNGRLKAGDISGNIANISRGLDETFEALDDILLKFTTTDGVTSAVSITVAKGAGEAKDSLPVVLARFINGLNHGILPGANPLRVHSKAENWMSTNGINVSSRQFALENFINAHRTEASLQKASGSKTYMTGEGSTSVPNTKPLEVTAPDLVSIYRALEQIDKSALNRKSKGQLDAAISAVRADLYNLLDSSAGSQRAGQLLQAIDTTLATDKHLADLRTSGLYKKLMGREINKDKLTASLLESLKSIAEQGSKMDGDEISAYYSQLMKLLPYNQQVQLEGHLLNALSVVNSENLVDFGRFYNQIKDLKFHTKEANAVVALVKNIDDVFKETDMAEIYRALQPVKITENTSGGFSKNPLTRFQVNAATKVFNILRNNLTFSRGAIDMRFVRAAAAAANQPLDKNVNDALNKIVSEVLQKDSTASTTQAVNDVANVLKQNRIAIERVSALSDDNLQALLKSKGVDIANMDRQDMQAALLDTLVDDELKASTKTTAKSIDPVSVETYNAYVDEAYRFLDAAAKDLKPDRTKGDASEAIHGLYELAKSNRESSLLDKRSLDVKQMMNDTIDTYNSKLPSMSSYRRIDHVTDEQIANMELLSSTRKADDIAPPSNVTGDAIQAEDLTKVKATQTSSFDMMRNDEPILQAPVPRQEPVIDNIDIVTPTEIMTPKEAAKETAKGRKRANTTTPSEKSILGTQADNLVSMMAKSTEPTPEPQLTKEIPVGSQADDLAKIMDEGSFIDAGIKEEKPKKTTKTKKEQKTSFVDTGLKKEKPRKKSGPTDEELKAIEAEQEASKTKRKTRASKLVNAGLDEKPDYDKVAKEISDIIMDDNGLDSTNKATAKKSAERLVELASIYKGLGETSDSDQLMAKRLLQDKETIDRISELTGVNIDTGAKTKTKSTKPKKDAFGMYYKDYTAERKTDKNGNWTERNYKMTEENFNDRFIREPKAHHMSMLQSVYDTTGIDALTSDKSVNEIVNAYYDALAKKIEGKESAGRYMNYNKSEAKEAKARLKQEIKDMKDTLKNNYVPVYKEEFLDLTKMTRAEAVERGGTKYGEKWDIAKQVDAMDDLPRNKQTMEYIMRLKAKDLLSEVKVETNTNKEIFSDIDADTARSGGRLD